MDIRYYIVRPDDDIQRVIKVIDNNRDGIALVVNKAGSLVGTITDGDIRRFMLSGCSSDELCGNVMNDKPLTAGTSASRKELINLIKQHRIRNIPLVDKDGRPVKVVNITDLINDKEPDFIAVVMAGGEGKRLRPLTEKLPKPMIRVGDSPLLEQIIRNLKRSGILNIFISVNYQADVIESCFKDGAEFGVKIQYLREGKKLGTAGALSMLTDIIDLPSQPILVMNGDIMTSVNLERFLEFHKQHRCSMSLAATEYKLNIPYGVLDLAGHYVMGIEEKPTRRFLCNAGIYAIDPDIIHMVPRDTYYDMTDLLKDVVRKGLPVSAFPIHEHWIDIGHKDDLKKAQKALTEF